MKRCSCSKKLVTSESRTACPQTTPGRSGGSKATNEDGLAQSLHAQPSLALEHQCPLADRILDYLKNTKPPIKALPILSNPSKWLIRKPPPWILDVHHRNTNAVDVQRPLSGKKESLRRLQGRSLRNPSLSGCLGK